MGDAKGGAIDASPVLSFYRDEYLRLLSQDGAKLMVIGYGFLDDHINNLICRARETNPFTMYLVHPSGRGHLRNINPTSRGAIYAPQRSKTFRLPTSQIPCGTRSAETTSLIISACVGFLRNSWSRPALRSAKCRGASADGRCATCHARKVARPGSTRPRGGMGCSRRSRSAARVRPVRPRGRTARPSRAPAPRHRHPGAYGRARIWWGGKPFAVDRKQ
jgi:hypothetical protein